MTFWLFSGWLQKSGALMRSSSLAICCFWPAASKIPPHGERLFAERLVFAVELFYSHLGFISILTDTPLFPG